MKSILFSRVFALNGARGFPPRRCLAPAFGAIALAASLAAPAQESLKAEFRVAATQGREVVVLPAASTSGQVRAASGWISGHSHETAAQRVHVVNYEGRTFRAATPLEGPWSRIVFDPSRRKFARLLPSVRAEIESPRQLEAAKRALGATRADFFEKLGFAILHLPDDLHPVEAVAKLNALSGRPSASIRLPRPPIQWR